jgi:hypothetical protein
MSEFTYGNDSRGELVVWCMPGWIKKVTPINHILRQYAYLKAMLWLFFAYDD